MTWLDDRAKAIHDKKSRDILKWASVVLGNRFLDMVPTEELPPEPGSPASLARPMAKPAKGKTGPVSRLILRLEDLKFVVEALKVVGKKSSKLVNGRDTEAWLLPAPGGFTVAVRGSETFVPVVTGKLEAACAVDADQLAASLRGLMTKAPAAKDVAMHVAHDVVTLVCGALVVSWVVTDVT